MKKYGNFWVPDVDAKGRRNHTKIQNLFGDKDGSIDPIVKAMADLLATRSASYSSDQIAIDAGANVGSYTRVLLGYYSRVISIEPMPGTLGAWNGMYMTGVSLIGLVSTTQQFQILGTT